MVFRNDPTVSIYLDNLCGHPYYNAREYSKYRSYEQYLDFLESVFEEVYRVTKEGRFFALNTSPVIVPRAGRKYSSRRYPVPFDIHSRLARMGWEFIDDIIWANPEKSAKNRIAGFEMHRRPLTYKANPRTEYVMVYRKKSYKLSTGICGSARLKQWRRAKSNQILNGPMCGIYPPPASERITVNLSLNESLVVINALAVRRAALRGGVWSTTGKQVEVPLMEVLCRIFQVAESCFAKSLHDDESIREIDFYLKPPNYAAVKCEVKLMGQGNPEGTDVIHARESEVFVASTLSDLNKIQLDEAGVLWTELQLRSGFMRFQRTLSTLKIPNARSQITSIQ